MSELKVNEKTPLLEIPTGAYIHMIGIGGISMSALAHILMFFEYRVSGSDRTETNLTQKLREAGVEISIGQRRENITTPDLVCYTAAISDDNPELQEARKRGIPTIERAELLGKIMKHYKFPLAVAGTHGKTTTTSMLSLILLAAKVEPTILVGGELPQIDGNFLIGKDDYLVFEACEYVESFLHFNPFLSVITNVEEDHLDYFSDLNHIISAFRKFAILNSPLGCIIVCSDDKNALSVVQNVEKRVIKYGINSRNNEIFAENIHLNENGQTEFDVYFNNEPFLTLKLNVHGEHNVRNALGALAAANELGIDKKYIKEGLENFGGTKRRFETLGKVNGFSVIDDYSHHPTEIKAALNAAKTLCKGDVWCVFQPHTYTRTKAFLKEFADALGYADNVIVADVYPAREKYDGSIHSCDLAILIDNGIYMNNFDAIKRYVLKNAKQGDMVITMGAGDIYKLGYDLIK